MAEFKLDVPHGQSLEEARLQLRQGVGQALVQYSRLLLDVDWSLEEVSVRAVGPNFAAEAWVDEEEVHVRADLSWLRSLVAGPVEQCLEEFVRETFPAAAADIDHDPIRYHLLPAKG
jgi:hypothetical protein